MNGIICIDKPAGMTSFDVVAILKRLTRERRAGHAGTLDPMATGVLPVFFGEATKAIPLLPNHDKRYTAGMRLGITTDTGDITGKTLTTKTVNVTAEEIQAAVESFRGPILQVPPMYSALKSGGRPLYEIAREGGSVERAARPVTIYDIGVTGNDAGTGDTIFDVSCSKGTYIRTLCEDIGEALGCGGTMASLRRTFAAGFDIEACATIETAKLLAEQDKISDIVLSVEQVFRDLPEVRVTEKQMTRFRNGGELGFERLNNPPKSGLCRVNCAGLFIGIGEADPDAGHVRVRCHFNRNSAVAGNAAESGEES